MSDVPQAPRRRSFWLIASLCLNFFLIGVIVTGLLVARNRMVAAAINGGSGGGLPPEMVLEMLPRSGALKMCGVLADRVETFRRLGREVLDARRDVFKVFRTEPFDANAFQAAIARQTNAQVAILQERQASIGDVVAKLTPDERRQFTREVVQRFFSVRRGAPSQRQPGRMRDICRGLGAAGAQTLPQ
jgi:uncharacterized membrane protein